VEGFEWKEGFEWMTWYEIVEIPDERKTERQTNGRHIPESVQPPGRTVESDDGVDCE
jgi:hypothetical protein